MWRSSSSPSRSSSVALKLPATGCGRGRFRSGGWAAASDAGSAHGADHEVVERADQVVVEAACRTEVVHQRDDLEGADKSGVVDDDRQVADQVVVGDLQQEVALLFTAVDGEEGQVIARGEADVLRGEL